jgi:hypothetical protein
MLHIDAELANSFQTNDEDSNEEDLYLTNNTIMRNIICFFMLIINFFKNTVSNTKKVNN